MIAELQSIISLKQEERDDSPEEPKDRNEKSRLRSTRRGQTPTAGSHEQPMFLFPIL